MKTKPAPTALEKMGLNSPMALALHLPNRYEDETSLLTIEEALQMGRLESVQTQGVVIQIRLCFDLEGSCW